MLVPLIVAAVLNRLKRAAPHGDDAGTAASARRPPPIHLYGALVAPLSELTARLGWGVLIVMALILTYQLCFNIWASFAFPFYLDYMHYTKDEVAFASKVFGIFMTMIGRRAGRHLFLRSGAFRRC